jgi:branched-subunit amino acid permease
MSEQEDRFNLGSGWPLAKDQPSTSRLKLWSKKFPNARLAICGLMLILLAMAVLGAIREMEKPVFNGKVYVYRDTPFEGWGLLLPVVGVSLLLACLAGMTIIVFAAYRAIRDCICGK